MNQYRKRPVVIEAVQYTGDNEIQIMDFVGQRLSVSKPPQGYEHDHVVDNRMINITIPTLEGEMRCNRFDYVIKGVKGEFYPCKPDIFDATYEKVVKHITPQNPPILPNAPKKIG